MVTELHTVVANVMIQNFRLVFISIAFTVRSFAKVKQNFILSVDVNDSCKIQQNFFVMDNKTIKLKLKCNVDLVAYYSFESEKEEK